MSKRHQDPTTTSKLEHRLLAVFSRFTPHDQESLVAALERQASVSHLQQQQASGTMAMMMATAAASVTIT